MTLTRQSRQTCVHRITTQAALQLSRVAAAASERSQPNTIAIVVHCGQVMRAYAFIANIGIVKALLYNITARPPKEHSGEVRAASLDS